MRRRHGSIGVVANALFDQLQHAARRGFPGTRLIFAADARLQRCKLLWMVQKVSDGIRPCRRVPWRIGRHQIAADFRHRRLIRGQYDFTHGERFGDRQTPAFVNRGIEAEQGVTI